VRILFVNYEYPPLGGGGGVFTHALATELAQRHEVCVLTSDRGLRPSRGLEEGVEVVRAPLLVRRAQVVASLPSLLAFVPIGILTGRRLLARRKFDLVNTHFALPSGPVGRWIAARARVPHVLTLLGGDVYDPSKWLSPHRHAPLRSMVRSLVEAADATVVASTDIGNRLREHYRPRCQTQRIPLATPTPPAAPLVAVSRRDLAIEDSTPLLVTVGRLIKRKDLGQMIRALGRLVDLDPSLDVHLLIVGSGPERPRLERQAERSGVADRITFVGQVSEERKHQLLAAADVYVSTSRHEGFGLVFLEAMNAGLPVVCYADGGQGDFLIPEETGISVPTGDVEAFASACRRVLGDQDLRERMSRRARAAAAELSIARCAARYEDLFRTLTESSSMVAPERMPLAR